MPKMTKERLEMFSDAVMAILLTLMALDLPVQLDNSLHLPQLMQSIGIYFISFCFIANLWYQHVFLLHQSDTVENSVVLLEFLMLFFLSLIPSFTRLMIQDIEQITVLLYGNIVHADQCAAIGNACKADCGDAQGGWRKYRRICHVSDILQSTRFIRTAFVHCESDHCLVSAEAWSVVLYSADNPILFSKRQG